MILLGIQFLFSCYIMKSVSLEGVQLDFEIAHDIQTRVRNRTFEGLPNVWAWLPTRQPCPHVHVTISLTRDSHT